MCLVLVKIKKTCRGPTQPGWGGGLCGTVKRVRQWKTSGTRGSFFCGLRGCISGTDPAKAMWESKLQITAETYRKASGSLQTAMAIFQNQNSSSYSDQVITHITVGHTAATRSEKYKCVVNLTVVEIRLSQSIRCFYESYHVNNLSHKANFILLVN